MAATPSTCAGAAPNAMLAKAHKHTDREYDNVVVHSGFSVLIVCAWHNTPPQWHPRFRPFTSWAVRFVLSRVQTPCSDQKITKTHYIKVPRT
jgi:hypothetical protein